MTRNKQIERDQVLKPCLNSCRNMLRQGIILEYKRLDAFDKDHKPGSPDIQIYLLKDELLWILMCECKKPIGGILSPAQIKYRDSYLCCKNVIYEVVTSVKQLDRLVEELTGFYQTMLDGINL